MRHSFRSIILALRQLRNHGAIRRLRRDEDGSVFVLTTMVIAFVTMGLTGLVLDGTRFYSLNNELQDLADAAALAGAKELNGEADAQTRATNRATNLLNNNPHWAQAGSGVIASVTFAGPTDPNDTDGAADPRYSRYIRVTTASRGVIPTFYQAVGVTTANMTSATATAEAQYVTCKTNPMMMCNPMEPNPFNAPVGVMFHLKPKGSGSSTFAPGDFGLLDPPGYTAAGADAIRDLLSKQSPPFCYANSVNPRPGHATNKVADGINIRFNHVPNGNTSGMDLTPAPVVLDGRAPTNPNNANQCRNPDPWAGGGLKLPRDPVLTPSGGVDIGTGPAQADLDAYWQSHYGSNWPADLNVPPRRYAGYMREQGKNVDGTAGPAAPNILAGTEPRGPTCAPTAPGGPDRRVLTVAIVDCLYWGVRGNAVNNVWANKYSEFFITEPSTDGSIYAEYLGSKPMGTTPGCTGSVCQIVRLVR